MRQRCPLAKSWSRSSVVWGVVFFLAGQLALGSALGRLCPEVRDPEFGTLLTSLRRRLAHTPDRPLVLVIGSSHTASGIRPSCLHLPPSAGGNTSEPVVFNFSTLWTGPVRQAQMFRRVLAEGVRPDWLLLEVWPPFLTHRPPFIEETYVLNRDVLWPDWPLMSRGIHRHLEGYTKLFQSVLAPAFSYRGRILDRWAHSLYPSGQPSLEGTWDDPAVRLVEDAGWLRAPGERPAADYFACQIECLAPAAQEALTDFEVDPAADRSLRDLLGLCAEYGVRVAFVLAPEHSALRKCYAPEEQARIDAYLGSLGAGRSIPILDTRDWVPDDDFLDFSHIHRDASAPYTRRFSTLLTPLLAGQPIDSPRNHSAAMLGETPF
jgi:hypothetical protein